MVHRGSGLGGQPEHRLVGAGGVDDARLGLMERGPAVRVDAEPPPGIVGAEELRGLAGSRRAPAACSANRPVVSAPVRTSSSRPACDSIARQPSRARRPSSR